jgi:LEA14-like dessication related protein
MVAVRKLLALLALAMAACAHRPKPPPPAPLPVVLPLIGLEAVKVEGLGFLGADFLFRARIENSNPFPLSVLRVDYGLQLERRSAASGSLSVAVALPAAQPGGGAVGTETVGLPVRVHFAGIAGVANVLAAEREAEYLLEGSVTFSTPAGEVAVPLSHAGRLVVPRLPRFRIEKAVLRSASPREVTIVLRLDVSNPNAFPIPAGRIGYGLFLSDREVVHGDLEVAAPIEGGASAILEAPVRISILKAGKAAARLLIPFTSLDVKVKGEAVFGGVPVPLDLGGSLLPGS